MKLKICLIAAVFLAFCVGLSFQEELNKFEGINWLAYVPLHALFTLLGIPNNLLFVFLIPSDAPIEDEGKFKNLIFKKFSFYYYFNNDQFTTSHKLLIFITGISSEQFNENT